MASGLRSISESSEEIIQSESAVCKYHGNTTVAISFCTVCDEHLCKTCVLVHQGSKALRGHKMLTSNNMSATDICTKQITETENCELHKTMPLNIYCINHDDVICGTCRLTDHGKCNTTAVTLQTKNIKVSQIFDETMSEVVGLGKKFKALKESRIRDKIKLKSNIILCLDDVQKSGKRMEEKLHELEVKLRKIVSDIEESVNGEIENHITVADDALNQINARIKFLDVCQKSQNEIAMFVCMKKANFLRKKYDVALTTLEQRVYPIEIRFKENDVTNDIMFQIQSMGTIETGNSTPYKIEPQPFQTSKLKKDPSHKVISEYPETLKANIFPSNISRNNLSLLRMSVGECQEIDVGYRYVWDCTFLGDSHIVLAFGYYGLRLLDENFKVLTNVFVESNSVAAIIENEVIVTNFNKQLQIVSIFSNMTSTKTLKMDRNCYGIDVFNDEIYVTCHDHPVGNGEVRVLNMDGVLQRHLGTSDEQDLFSGPNCIRVNRNGSKVFLSDTGTDKITCLSQQGDILFQYTDGELKGPTGMFVDDGGTVLVCGEYSLNVHLIDTDCIKQRILLSEMVHLNRPRCISFRPRDKCLVVGQAGFLGRNKTILVCLPA